MKVSVIIPTYNGAPYIAEALASVCAQTFNDLEIVVLDDGSTDHTLQIVAQCHDPRLRIIRNSARLGLAGNWNAGIAQSQGEYILILHQDDRLAPTMLATRVKQLDENPRAGFAYGAYRLIDSAGQTLQIAQPFAVDHVWDGAEEFKHHIRKNYVQCPTIVVRRACYESLGGFNPQLKYALDWEMWLRIESHGYQVTYSAQVLSDWRLHAVSATRVLANEPDLHIQDELAALDCVFEHIPDEYAELRLLRQRAHFELIKQCLLRAGDAARYHDWSSARRHWRAAQLAYARGGNWHFLPFLARDAIRFTRQRLS